MPADIRPTQLVARKSIFDILGQNMEGIDLLDLFSGSGAVGIEALSREALKCFFVEKDLKCADVIEENLKILNIEKGYGKDARYEVLRLDAFVAIKMLSQKGLKFDIVFADPPYGRDLAKKALKTIFAYDILYATSTVVIQHDKSESLPETQGSFFLVRKRTFGSTVLSIYQNNDPGSSADNNLLEDS